MKEPRYIKKESELGEYQRKWGRTERVRNKKLQYKKEHADEIKKYNKEYCLRNRQKIIESSKVYYRKNKEKIKETKKKYKEKNKDKILEQTKIYNKKNREKLLARKRKNDFNLSDEEYRKILIRSNGVCEICKNKETSKKNKEKTKELSLDHCHETGKARGLLCHACNLSLGLMKDNVTLLENAINYLIYFNKKNG